jgi:hypothetical protein
MSDAIFNNKPLRTLELSQNVNDYDTGESSQNFFDNEHEQGTKSSQTRVKIGDKI